MVGCTLYSCFTQVEGWHGREKLRSERHGYSLARCTGRKAPEGGTCLRGEFNAVGAEVPNRLIHAAPMELTAVVDGRYYTHGAPAGT